MKTIETTVYQYNELSEKAKEKAIEWAASWACTDDWYQSTYDDAERIGLKLTGFDLDRNRHAKGHFINGAEHCAKEIMKEHGKDCETYKTAYAYLLTIDALAKEHDQDLADGNPEEHDAQREEEDADFLQSLLEDYSIMLQRECDYLLSHEALEETIEANEYTFTAEGKRFG